jgi:hypothetical protein
MAMHIKKYYITLVLLLLCHFVAHSQVAHKEIYIDFRVNSTVIDTAYLDNAARLREIRSLLQSISENKAVDIIEVCFCGTASPEGSDQRNRRLSLGRIETIETLVRSQIDIPDSIIARDDTHINFDYLKAQVLQSDMEHKDTIISILEEEAQLVDYHHPETHIDSRILRLQQLYGGTVWTEISKYFLRMRNASVILVTYNFPFSSSAIDSIASQVPKMQPVALAPCSPLPVTGFCAPEWHRKLRVKTNLLGLGLSVLNLDAEMDINKHWSFTFPVYYSAVNYFKKTIKFRTFALQPEIRYWLSENNDGFFAGAHLGMAYFNVAWNKLFRYQSHQPLLGGGLSIGYRKPLGRSKHWSIDFCAGVGAYSLYWDRFVNVENGMWLDSKHSTYIGVDHLSVSLAYAFDISKRKKNVKK